MNNGKKSAISRLWNSTRDEERIARALGLDVSDVKAYLRTRRGYPNGIVLKDDRKRSAREAFKSDDAIYGKHGPTPKPTLPRLKFLEAADE